MYRNGIKRFLDFWIALIALVCISPILLIVSIWLHFANKGAGAFFFQERPGLHGKVFKIVKFKTMTDERDANGNLLPDEMRLTKVGKFVRSSSIDELPQLINVLKGDMALIGPRPLLPKYLPLYSNEQARRHDVRPGITDPASIKFRNENELMGQAENPEDYYINVIMQEKIRLYLEYVENASFWYDIKLIFKTFKVIISE